MASTETLDFNSAANDNTLDSMGETALQRREDSLPSTGLLSFYDRLRVRIERTLERRAGKLGPGVASALLLIPDVFILMMRLALDKEVPKSTRAMLGSTVAYFVLPIDLMPEGVVGPMGYLDDLVIALGVLSQTFGKELEPFAEKYWSGTGSLRTVLGDVLGAANSLLGSNLYSRVIDLLGKRGIELEPTP